MVNGRLGQSCAPAEVLAAASAARAAMILMLGMTVSPRSITRPRRRSEDRHPAGRGNVMAGQKALCNRVFKRAASSFAPTSIPAVTARHPALKGQRLRNVLPRSAGRKGPSSDQPKSTLLTQLIHGPLKTFAAQKDYSFLR